MQNTQFHGNTFLFINKNPSEFALTSKSQEVDLTMYYEFQGNTKDKKEYNCTFFNKDKSEAKLCGNALFGLMNQDGIGKYLFKTKAGIFEGINTGKKLVLAMKKAKIYNSNQSIPNCQAYWFYVNVGNNHHIILHNKYKYFKEACNNMNNEKPRMNTHILKKINADSFKVRCFERGVGETQACGSGAYAIGSAMMQHFNLDKVKIIMKGGKYVVSNGFLTVKI